MTSLNATKNRYDGIFVASLDLPNEVDKLNILLKNSLDIWTVQKIKVVWIKISISKAQLLPTIYAFGFENHHCHKDFIMVTKKLELGAVVPPFAKHTIGVGGLVINHKNEVLSIREKSHIKTHPHNWKFPGGMLDPEEHFENGVIREVMEETNIETVFESLIGFRHHHKGQFSTSNIYAICRLKPLSVEITMQESEIADARWFPIDEYLADEKIGQYNKAILKSALIFPGLKSIKLSDYMSSENEYEIFLIENGLIG